MKTVQQGLAKQEFQTLKVVKEHSNDAMLCIINIYCERSETFDS